MYVQFEGFCLFYCLGLESFFMTTLFGKGRGDG